MSMLLIVVLVLLIEFYGWISLRQILPQKPLLKKSVVGFYIVLTLTLWLLLITYRTWGYHSLSKELRNIVATLFLSIAVGKIFLTLFHLSEDIIRLFRWLIQKSSSKKTSDETPIQRSEFLNKVALLTASVPFGTIVYGAVNNAYNYRFHHVPVAFPNLPKAFDGFKIVQLSDIHAGSFARTKPIENVIVEINKLKPDLILFTGDLVNNIADEMRDYRAIFARLSAKYGVMSVTGNHDYGDYIPWNSEIEKQENFKRLINVHKEMGWDILMNENRIIEKSGDKIAILGVENWGAKMRFPRYGILPSAYAGTEAIPFKILMSHDPSHWDAQIRPQFPDIDLTLSGHTHGFQFGIESKVLKWSPSQWVYKQWAGLYKEGAQYLYVNRGFGFLGYPGRVGILPEVTLIELKRI